MTGRGIDQILPHPGDPRPAGFSYIWGDALAELARMKPGARIVNLETAVTTRGEPWPGKGIHYRMNPANLPCLTAAGLDCCVLANNHVLDWGREGLAETLATLRAAGLRTAGAEAVGRRIAAQKRRGDIVVASIHWGGNWGYDVASAQRDFARALIGAGVDVVRGHSSHHPKGIEVYRERPILYGCGDLINDYEGIEGHEAFRPGLSLMYFPVLGGLGSRPEPRGDGTFSLRLR
jgi:poly-gamma-glutamate synthesis protein (capsule biosynthesis protein)